MSLPDPLVQDPQVQRNFDALNREIQALKNHTQYFNVKDFGAKGDFYTDDTAAFQAALRAAEENKAGGIAFFQGQGIIYVPAGIYRLSEALVTQDYAIVSYLGDGPYASIVFWDTDLGAGNHAISDEWVAGDTSDTLNKRRFIQDIAFQGGLTNADTQAASGIKLTTGMTMYRVIVTFFNSGYGVDCQGNHQTIDDCKIRENEFGVSIADVNFALGDQYISNTMLVGNYTASIHIPDGSVGVFELEDVHLGFSPYGIYAEASAEVAMNRCTIHKCYCESFGNAFINTNNRYLTNTAIRDTVVRKTTGYANADPINAVIDCGTSVFQHNVLDNITLDLSGATPEPPAFVAAAGVIANDFRLSENILGHILSGMAFVDCNNGPIGRNSYHWGSYRARLCRAQAAIAVEDAVEIVQFESSDGRHTMTVQKGTVGGIPAGIALHSVSNAGDTVLVAFEGMVVGNASGAIAALDKLTLAASGAVATAAAGDDIIGIARAADSGGDVGVFLNPTWLA